jgi:hypothetical protein
MKGMSVKQRRFIFLAVSGGIVFCLMSCAASNESIITTPITMKLSQYKDIMVSVTTSVANPISDEEKDLLVNEISKGLELTGKFQQVKVPDPSGQITCELLVKAEVTKINRVSRAARVMVGGLAGQASVELQVKLVDPKDDKLIGETNVTGKSSGGTIFAGTTEDAIKEGAKGAVAFVVSSF